MGNHAAAPGIFYWTCPSGHVQFVSVSLCDNVSCSQHVRMMLCKIFVIVEILQKDQYQQQADLRALCVGLISSPVISSGEEIAMLCFTPLKYTAQW